jgi:archaemetzincin
MNYIFFFLILILVTCDTEVKQVKKKTQVLSEKTYLKTKISDQVIHILPLGNLPDDQVKFVQSSIAGFYGCNVLVKSKVNLSADLKNDPPGRYVANKILAKFKSDSYTLILTNVDIVTHDKIRKVKEWGVLGLGLMPGKTCVVSTFRMNRAKVKVSYEKFLERLKKVCIHEIGHNLSLPHCSKDEKCLMNDANGSIKKVDKESLVFCDYCQPKIKLLEN